MRWTVGATGGTKRGLDSRCEDSAHVRNSAAEPAMAGWLCHFEDEDFSWFA